jgi:hypothetical protein
MRKFPAVLDKELGNAFGCPCEVGQTGIDLAVKEFDALFEETLLFRTQAIKHLMKSE